MDKKYQEAFDKVKQFDDIRLKDLFAPDNNISEELSILQELVDKATPIKPELVGNEYESYLCCKGCDKPIINVWNKKEYKPNYCHYCGQKLDWTEEN